MKTSVRIYNVLGIWWLEIQCINCSGVKTIDRLMHHKRLIDALDTASQLQLHVDNSAELALNQYRKVI